MEEDKTYRPLPPEVTIKDSPIEGFGLFAVSAIKGGTNLLYMANQSPYVTILKTIN